MLHTASHTRHSALYQAFSNFGGSDRSTWRALFLPSLFGRRHGCPTSFGVTFWRLLASRGG